jgi:prolyl 4-hydroxylase
MITIIIIIILIIIVYYYFYYKKKEHLTNMPENKAELRFSSIDAEYIKPRLVKDLLTEVECRQIIDFCVESKLKENTVHISPQKMKYRQEYNLDKKDPLIIKLVKQLALDLEIPFKNAEDVQVIRYVPNQYTKSSVDACCNSNNAVCKEYLKTGGQRILTCIIYLNKDFIGGETYFENLDLTLLPKVGQGIAFFNVAQNINRCHPKSSHSGLIIENGEKWIMKVRFREYENTLFRKTISW